MRYQFRDRTDGQEQAGPPAMCPACKSRDVMTSSKIVTSASYWRCRACGEIWNAERLQAANRYLPRPR